MGVALTLTGYVVAGVFLLRVGLRLLLLGGAAKEPRDEHETRFASFVMAAIDVLFLRRLFLTNKGLWLGEWLFHVSFVFVALRHLRFFLEPVPGLLVASQPFGVFAGYVLPLSLVYILLTRFIFVRSRYVSKANLFLTVTLLFAGLTGVIMRLFDRQDVLSVKHYVLRGLNFDPSAAPEGLLFAVHVALFLVFTAWLPSHILSAPLTILDATERDLERARILRK